MGQQCCALDEEPQLDDVTEEPPPSRATSRSRSGDGTNRVARRVPPDQQAERRVEDEGEKSPTPTRRSPSLGVPKSRPPPRSSSTSDKFQVLPTQKPPREEDDGHTGAARRASVSPAAAAIPSSGVPSAPTVTPTPKINARNSVPPIPQKLPNATAAASESSTTTTPAPVTSTALSTSNISTSSTAPAPRGPEPTPSEAAVLPSEAAVGPPPSAVLPPVVNQRAVVLPEDDADERRRVRAEATREGAIAPRAMDLEIDAVNEEDIEVLPPDAEGTIERFVAFSDESEAHATDATHDTHADARTNVAATVGNDDLVGSAWFAERGVEPPRLTWGQTANVVSVVIDPYNDTAEYHLDDDGTTFEYCCSDGDRTYHVVLPLAHRVARPEVKAQGRMGVFEFRKVEKEEGEEAPATWIQLLKVSRRVYFELRWIRKALDDDEGDYSESER